MLTQVGVVENVLGGAVEDDLAHVQDDRAVGEMKRGNRVLFDDDRGHAERLDLLERPLDFLDNHRREAFIRFVEEQELHVSREGPSDGKHLLLGDEAMSDDERARFTSIIHDESQRLTRLLDEILDINRLEAGVIDLPLAPVNMKSVISAALDSIAGLTHSRKVDISVHASLDGLMVQANADRLRQVLINVLSNAVKYNPSRQPRIEVRTVTDSKEVWVDVIDNGGGVTRADAATIFEKFARGNRPSTDQGAGLGLPISRAFMNAMGGGLTVEFTGESASFFRLTLRRAQADANAAGQVRRGL